MNRLRSFFISSVSVEKPDLSALTSLLPGLSRDERGTKSQPSWVIWLTRASELSMLRASGSNRAFSLPQDQSIQLSSKFPHANNRDRPACPNSPRRSSNISLGRSLQPIRNERRWLDYRRRFNTRLRMSSQVPKFRPKSVHKALSREIPGLATKPTWTSSLVSLLQRRGESGRRRFSPPCANISRVI